MEGTKLHLYIPMRQNAAVNDPSNMARLSITLLGSFQVTLEGRPITHFATDKARALLAYLALHTDGPQRREALAGLLWPDQPEIKARQNLRQALTFLRQALNDTDETTPFLLVDRETVQFNATSNHWLDVTAFTKLSDACQRHRHIRLERCLPCLRRLEQLVALYQGEFLAQFFLADSLAFEEWVLIQREWLHQRALEALAILADYHERRGEFGPALEYARRQVTLEPWREEAHRQLMRLLALTGERSAALAQYQRCCQSLQAELGVAPTAETTALYRQIEQGTFKGPPVPPPLPLPPTALVDRTRELGELAELLANPASRLVTLSGPGGSGKTRLALQLAADQVGLYPDGIHYVPLAESDPTAGLASALVTALHVPLHGRDDPQVQLLRYLRPKTLLLVLDALETFAADSGLLATLLQQAPGLLLLVTSRERLGLQEEWVYPVEGLSYPPSEAAPDPAAYGALALFQQRARQVNPRFELATEAAAVVALCRLMEGLPLGIELAAAWTGTRACAEIVADLERNLADLASPLRNAPARQRSLRATLDYSWQRLSPAEREAFRRLSVFRGGFQAEAAVAVAGIAPPMLVELVDKSLLRRTGERYELHEVLRQYAAGQLQADPVAQTETEQRHLHHFTAFLARQALLVTGPEQKAALQAITGELGNARRAWELAVAHGKADALASSLPALYEFYDSQSRFQEGLDWLAPAIARWRDDPTQSTLYAMLLARQGAFQRRLGRYPPARATLEQALALLDPVTEPAETIFALVKLADVARAQGQRQEAERVARRALALARQHEYPWGAASALLLLAMLYSQVGALAEAETCLQEGLTFSRAAGDALLSAAILTLQADVACYRGAWAEGRALQEASLAISRALDNPFNIALHLNNLGTILHQQGDYPAARACYQESRELCHRIGDLVGEAIALSNLGEIAFVLGEMAEAQRCYQAGLALGRATDDSWTMTICLNNLGEIAVVNQHDWQARSYLAEALRLALETEMLIMVTKIMVNLAAYYARQGAPERAAALLGLIRHHPASEEDVRQKADRLWHELALTLPASAATEDSPPLEAVAMALLAELTS